MTLSPEIETKGLKAYEQARAFENIRSWRLPLSYFIFALIPVLNGIGLWRAGHTLMSELNFLCAFVFVVASWFHWRRLRARYAENLALLRELERDYGDQLPWVQVEKHFAELDRIKQELAEERGPK
jgi:hypothetical protein